MTLSLSDIQAAHARIKDKINRTPMLSSSTLNLQAQAQLFFKCENLQKVGAFKARGATNAVFLLSEEEARRGVATHSSGNHAAALARAAKLRGIPAYIVMPTNAPKVKQASVKRYHGEIILCEPTLEARERTANEVVARTGATLIHPYNDWRIMAGQGTSALEMLADVPELDIILCPVGGGGHLSGIAVAAKGLKPDIKVFGIEPSGADDAAQSFKSGQIVPATHPNTIADGLRTSLGEHTFATIRQHVDDILLVSESSIVTAMRAIWEIMKLVVEPSGAVPYAALLDHADLFKGKRVGIILSGGNVDLDTLPWNRSAA
jgi:threonine dehydratase